MQLQRFLQSLSEADQAHWQRLTARRRREAEQRFAVFEEWHSGAIPAKDAIARSGLSSSRFYRLAAQWRDNPSLDALGVGIRAPRPKSRLDPEIINALQAKVAEVVRLNADASVSRQAELLLDLANVPLEQRPGVTTVRSIVEAERRRIAATGRLGHAINLDCVAINLPQADGRPYILFIIIDAGTRLALGCAITRTPDAANGYAAAARNALSWISDFPRGLPWAEQLMQTVVIAGSDKDQSRDLVTSMAAAKLGGNLLLATGSKRYGSKFREAFGDRVGRIAITPARTEKGDALPDNGNMTPWPMSEATDEVQRTFREHNAGLLEKLDTDSETHPSPQLEEFLQRLSQT